MNIGRSLNVMGIYDKFTKGKKVSENYWDYTLVPVTASIMKEQYGISFTDNIIPDDPELIDNLFKAGFNMLVTTGFYCPDLGRMIEITPEDIWEGIDKAPKKVKLGSGKDSVILESRHGNARRRPVVKGGPTAALVSEGIYSKMMQSYAQEHIVDTLFNGVLNTLGGCDPRSNSPREIYSVMAEMKLTDIAKCNSGRPGMCVTGPETAISSGARISANLTNFGLRPCDAHDIPQRNEMKIDLTSMNMLAASEINDDVVMMEALPIFGGYCGGLEETAICDVAVTLASFALFNVDFHTDGPIHVKRGVTTARETLKIAGHVAAAIDANTSLLLGNMYYPCAGPCTEMCFLENAAQAITDAASGRELIATSASAKGVVLDKTTGMEARFAGKVAQAAAGMKIDDINDILNSLISRYETRFSNAPEGKRFQDCYDLDTLTPTDEHVEVYCAAMDIINDYGLNVRY